jgi:GNAT superfamily N-acetyltransferase
MKLRVEPVTQVNRRKIKEIYLSSFKKEERMPFWLMLIMAKMKTTEFLSFYDGDTLCGFVYYAGFDDLIYVLYFAVDSNLRSKGYGSQVLSEIESLNPGKKLVLSIERCDIDVHDIENRQRRKRFYLKNGYVDTGYMIELAKIKQEVLVKHGTFDADEFTEFFRKYSNGMMKTKIWKVSD